MPLMNNEQASVLMKEFEKIIEVQAGETVFRLNVNPIRTGLALFKTFDDIQTQFGYSLYCTNMMK